MTLAEDERGQNVAAAADSDHQHRSVLAQIVGQRRNVVFEMLKRFYAAVEFRDDGRCTGIDVQIKLFDLMVCRVPWTQPPTERSAVVLTNMNSRERVPFLVQS